MGLFKKTPKNRRRRSQRKPETKPWFEGDAGKTRSAKGRGGDLVDQVYQLNAQIGAIESYLQKRTLAEEVRKRMHREGIIPPADSPTASRSRRNLSHAQKRRYHAERNRNGLHFLFLFCLACALVWWLVYSGI